MGFPFLRKKGLFLFGIFLRAFGAKIAKYTKITRIIKKIFIYPTLLNVISLCSLWVFFIKFTHGRTHLNFTVWQNLGLGLAIFRLYMHSGGLNFLVNVLFNSLGLSTLPVAHLLGEETPIS